MNKLGRHPHKHAIATRDSRRLAEHGARGRSSLEERAIPRRQTVPDELVLQGLLNLRRLLENADNWLGGVGHFDIHAIDAKGRVPTEDEYDGMCVEVGSQLVVDGEARFDFEFSGFQYHEDFVRYTIEKEN